MRLFGRRKGTSADVVTEEETVAGIATTAGLEAAGQDVSQTFTAFHGVSDSILSSDISAGKTDMLLEQGEGGDHSMIQMSQMLPLDAAARTRPTLSAIPDYMLEEHPYLKLSEYDMARDYSCLNALAMVHNAARLEMADFYGDVVPSVEARVAGRLVPEDKTELVAWWDGFVRFVLTTSIVDDFLIEKAFKDVYLNFDKETRAIEKLYQKVKEKNNVYLEMAFRKMGKAVEAFDMNANSAENLIATWNLLTATLTDIYGMAEELIGMIDAWARGPIEYKDLEKSFVKIYLDKKRWGAKDDKRGEMIVILTRWVSSEPFMRMWMEKNLPKKYLKQMDKWMEDYRRKRLAIIYGFHQRTL